MRWFFTLPVVVLTLTLTFTPTWSEDRDDWIDPNDMLNFDPSTNTMKKNKVQIPDLKTITTTPSPQHATTEDSKQCLPCESNPPCKECPLCPECVCDEADRACPEPVLCPPCECEPAKECVCEQAALPLLRQYIKSILTHIGDEHPVSGTEEFTFHISLSQDRFTMLHKFVTTGNQKHVHDVHEILSTMINRVASSKLGRLEKTAQWLEDKIGLKLDRLIQFFMLGALASIVLLIEIKLQIAWRRRVSQLIVFMFVVSVPWTWFELYKQAEIKQQSMATKTVPKECEGERDAWSALKSYFTLQDDKCHEYYEHLMIDPVIRVPPTKAIAVTFVRFFVAPLKDVGGAISEFIRALLIDLPVTLYPVAIGIVGLFLFMFLFMWFGYSIRLPFFLTIERSPQLSVADSQLHQAIQENSQQTVAQLEKLQASLESRESELADKMLQFERKQQLALEYMTSEPSISPAGSPTISRSEVRDSPSISRSPVKKRSEVKVASAQNFSLNDSQVASPTSCDSIGAKDTEASASFNSRAKNRNDDSAKNRNENGAVDVNKSAYKDDNLEDNCVQHDIATLKPDGTRD
ncbi:chloride channel CLIC-like protein 1 [Mercenaria mercenaria]|uniref:chloride channel CLIC-like protein 1 n=1 Tax=Mercenaria mercenaria TaxID=6596 RepID=UPI00234F1A14|nr:chloride channel CLIC-like protein 1 [Mercenaria mercenaria]XP_045157842.2 chloride channel CLIC-like protein 1 [Mercenaria mercenaria]XP_045157843.2 chloride channel CLIC-like protein 1 [Mercenaria mercenaria]XP_053395275.1 chloride channel CLIC-like protein 1 [Mercenaria mercenaria]